MRLPGFFFVSVWLVTFSLAAPSKPDDPTATLRQRDPALQTALDELTRLNSYIEAGVEYPDYCNRLLDAKGNIDVALRGSNDKEVVEAINRAVKHFIDARDAWKMKLNFEGQIDAWFPEKTPTALKYTVEWGVNLDLALALARLEMRFALQLASTDDEQRPQLRHEYVADLERTVASYTSNNKIATGRDSLEEADKPKPPLSEADKQRVAEQQQRERIRRFAPEGTVYNLKPITVTVKNKKFTLAFGTELKLIKKNSDGTVHIEKGELQADVPADDVTDDRDVVAAFRTLAATAESEDGNVINYGAPVPQSHDKKMIVARDSVVVDAEKRAAEQKKQDEAEARRPQVTSSLQSIGGGGGHYP